MYLGTFDSITLFTYCRYTWCKIYVFDKPVSIRRLKRYSGWASCLIRILVRVAGCTGYAQYAPFRIAVVLGTTNIPASAWPLSKSETISVLSKAISNAEKEVYQNWLILTVRSEVPCKNYCDHLKLVVPCIHEAKTHTRKCQAFVNGIREAPAMIYDPVLEQSENHNECLIVSTEIQHSHTCPT